MNGMEYLVQEKIDKFCGILEKASGPVDLATLFNYLTFDILGGNAFSC